MSDRFQPLHRVCVQGKGRGSADGQAQVIELAMAQRKPGVKGAVDADDLPRAAAALFHDCLFLRPDAPEGGELPIRMFRFHFGMFAEAEDRICQRAPVGAVGLDDF